MPKTTHIVIDLLPPSELPPEKDATVDIDDQRGELTARLHCRTPQAARKYGGQLLQAIYRMP